MKFIKPITSYGSVEILNIFSSYILEYSSNNLILLDFFSDRPTRPGRGAERLFRLDYASDEPKMTYGRRNLDPWRPLPGGCSGGRSLRPFGLQNVNTSARSDFHCSRTGVPI